MRHPLWCIVLGCTLPMLLPTEAHAAWRVSDITSQKELKLLRQQQDPGRADSRRSTTGTDDKPADPSLLLDKEQPLKSSQLDATALRCPKPRGRSGGRSAPEGQQQQWQICREIVSTELAQYRYALAMREVAIARQTRLAAIEDERATLTRDTDAGRLHSNTNALSALHVRVASDEQQYRTYMDAYAARLGYLRALQQAIAQTSINGRGAAEMTPLQGAVSLLTLDLALRAARTPLVREGGRP